MKEYIIQVEDNPTWDGSRKVFETKELVRCKDCWKREYDNCPFYGSFDYKPADDWFCADGERKEGR